MRSDYRHVSRGSYCNCTLCTHRSYDTNADVAEAHSSCSTLIAHPQKLWASAPGSCVLAMKLHLQYTSLCCSDALAYCSIIAKPSTSLHLRLPRVTDAVYATTTRTCWPTSILAKHLACPHLDT